MPKPFEIDTVRTPCTATSHADAALHYYRHALAELQSRLARLDESQHALRVSGQATLPQEPVLDAARVAAFSWDIASGAVYLSARWREMLGGPPTETVTSAPAFGALVHPDDAARYRAGLIQAFKGETERFECEFRVRAEDGGWRWIVARGRIVERDEYGRALRMIGAATDIDALKLAEERVRRHGQELEALHDCMRELAQQDETGGALRCIADAAQRLLHGDGCAVRLQSAEGRLVLAHASRAEPHAVEALAMRAAQAGRIQADAHAALAVPLADRDRLIGVIAVWGASVPEQDGIRLLSLFALAAAAVLARLASEQEARRSETRFRSLLEWSSDWYWEQDECLRLTRLSGRALERTGFAPERDLGRAYWELEGVECLESGWAALRHSLATQQPFRDLVYRRRNAAGQWRYHSISGEPVFDDAGRFKGYRGIGRDVTDRFDAEQRIHRLSHYDSLCGLPNRVLFQQRLQQALARARRFERPLAVLSLELDRFKNINDSFGHVIGDRVLCEVAERLTRVSGVSDIVARLGGDEFAVLLESFEAAGEVSVFARALLDAVAQPYLIAGQEYHLTACVGISLFPQDADDADALLRAADTAMNRAKEQGKNAFQFYSAQMNVQAYERLALESKLRRALERGELALHYQPMVDLASGRIVGVEALARWQQPDGCSIEPAVFIPVAEDSGMIDTLGRWVLREACQQVQAWRAAGLGPLRVAVNLSPRQFLREDLLAHVAQIIAETRIDPGWLEFEITERLMFVNPGHAAAVLRALKLMGVQLALDDFGTGYSSLWYLKRFPFDCVKIDRVFVRDLPDDGDAAAITRAVIAMAHSLRMKVTAEGVETEAQRRFLQDCGCDYAQGNLFSPALAAEAFAARYASSMLRSASAVGAEGQEG
ncbi:MAG: EAL domain-containing protein [Pseudomonadota bacterium]